MRKNHAIPIASLVLIGFFCYPLHVTCLDAGTQSLTEISAEANHAINAGDLSAAAAIIKRGLKIDPNWKEGLWKAGLVFYQENQFEAARSNLSRLTRVDATRGVAWALLGMCELQLGQFRAAIRDITKANRLGIPPQSGLRRAALLDRAIAQNNLGNFGTAVARLNEIVKRLPGAGLEERERLIAIYGYASLHKSTNASLSPQQAALLQGLGEALYANASGDRAHAKSLMESLLQKYPEEPMLHYTYGNLLVSWLDNDAANKQFHAELAVNPNNLAAMLALAYLGLNTGKVSEALPYALAASKMSPNFYLPHLYMGRLLIRAGHLHQACHQLEVASRLAPSNSEVRFVLATTYRRLGRIKDAQREYEEYRRLEALDNDMKKGESVRQ